MSPNESDDQVVEDSDEIAAYLEHRLRVAGRELPLFATRLGAFLPECFGFSAAPPEQATLF
jgi:hypothetical protein